MWIDSDTMIINPAFQLPLNKFAGKDLVIWGNETALLSGDGRSGVYVHPPPLSVPAFSPIAALESPSGCLHVVEMWLLLSPR